MSSTEIESKHAFYPLRVARVIEETHDAVSFVLDVPGSLAALFRYRAGQFLTLEIALEGGPLRRCYSLASSPQHDPVHKITVKRVRDGRASNWLNDRVREGDVLLAQPPEGRFVLTGTERPLLLFAGGSGITPVISLLKTALATTRRRARLVYANRDERSIIFHDELLELARQAGDRLDLIFRQDDREGFVREANVTSLIGGLEDGEPYLCGPSAFMDTVERGLLASGVPAERVHIERFLSLPAPGAPHPSVSPGDTEQVPETVLIKLGGVSSEVRYRPGQSLLRAALDASLDAPYSCEEGFCGSCVARLLEGEVRMDADDALSAEEKRRGLILACQSRPLTRRCSIEFLD